jgi:hypothetical protein
MELFRYNVVSGAAIATGALGADTQPEKPRAKVARKLVHHMRIAGSEQTVAI